MGLDTRTGKNSGKDISLPPSGVQRGANGAPAPGIQDQRVVQRVKLQKFKCC